jgi:hypothetical protein
MQKISVIMQTVSHFSLRVWRKGQAEPSTWQLQAYDVTSQGSIVIATHRADITVGSFHDHGILNDLRTPQPGLKEASSRRCIAARYRAWDITKPSGPLPIDSAD